MASITLRSSLSRNLTADEVDANFTSVKTEVEAATAALQNKQAKLTAGTNVSIDSNNVISVTGESLSTVVVDGITDATVLGKALLQATDAASARSNLSLGSAATASTTAFAPASHTTDTANPHATTKAQVGLGAVDNTADTDKPVSGPQQTALNLKADTSTVNSALALKADTTTVNTALALKAPLASPTFTGTVTVPTAAANTNTTQAASTAFVMGGQRPYYSSGAPSASLGVDGDECIRTDKPHLGVLYVKVSGAWQEADNSYTLATLPTPSSTYAGRIVSVTDACTDGTNTWAEDFQCVTYNGGTNYYWVPYKGIWKPYRNRAVTSSLAGNGAFQTVSSVTLPSASGVYVPGMDIRFDIGYLASGTTATKDFIVRESVATGGGGAYNIRILDGAISAGTNPGIGALGLFLRTLPTNINQQYALNFSSGALYNAGTTVPTNVSPQGPSPYTFTLPGKSFDFGQVLNAADAGQFIQREVTFVYP